MDFRSVNLVYFSGTGGTARVADAFEKALLNRSITVQRAEIKGKIQPVVPGDFLVLLFPVYAFNAPKPIEEWIEQAPLGYGKPVVVISVSGGGEISPNTACRVATIRRLERKGYDIVYEKMFVMPSNFLIGYDDSLCAMVLHAAPMIAEKIVANIMAGVRHRTVPYGIDRIASKLGVLEKVGGKIFGKRLKVNENCVDCGWCVANCPRENIIRTDGKSAFGSDCVLCLRCVYGCPQNAIEPGIGKFMVVSGGYNLNKIESRTLYATVYPKISHVAKDLSLRGVKEYLIESDCYEL